MRALAAILILSACSYLHAHQPPDIQTIRNIVNCSVTLGPIKCLNALTAWTAAKVNKYPNLKLNIRDDLEKFPWIKYRNNTEDELYSEVCEGTEKLLRRQALSLTVIPGYRLELLSKGNGTLNVDVYKMELAPRSSSKKKDADTSGRSSIKKAKKMLSNILPFLVLPGMFMSAVLPFFLPALKFMVVSVGMLNQMALTGAVFTLLRNNAFNDHYEHKVVYVNEGYKNEKHTHHNKHYEEDKPSGYEIADAETIEEMPLDSDWIKEYYGQNVQFEEHGHHQIKRENNPYRSN